MLLNRQILSIAMHDLPGVIDVLWVIRIRKSKNRQHNGKKVKI